MCTVDDKRSVQEICKKCAMKWKGRKQGKLKGWSKNFQEKCKGITRNVRNMCKESAMNMQWDPVIKKPLIIFLVLFFISNIIV